MPGEKKSAGGKVGKIDVKSFLIQQRLAWLANKRNWDGRLPQPKSLSPSAAGSKRGTGQVRRDWGPSSECGEQAPGWEGKVRDTAISPARQSSAGTGVSEAHQDGSKRDDAGSHEGESRASIHASTESAPSPGRSIAGADLIGEVADSIANVPADAIFFAAARSNAGKSVQVPPSQRSDDWSVLPSTSVVRPSCSKVGPDDEQDADFTNGDSDEDTAAGDNSNETSGGGGSKDVNDGRLDATGSSQKSSNPGDGGDMPSFAPETNDTVSDLSCPDAFARSRAADDGLRNMLRPVDHESIHDSSSESPQQFCPPTPRSDDDEMSVSHVSHLMQERRRWKLRALEAEHELSSTRSPRAHGERGGDEAVAAVSLPAEGAGNQNSTPRTTQVSARDLFSSDVSALGSSFEFDSRLSTISDGRTSTAASPRSVERPYVDVGPSSLDPVDTAANDQLSASTSRVVGRMPAVAGQYGGEGLPVDRSDANTSEDRDDHGGFCYDAAGGKRSGTGSAMLCHQQKEIAALKEKLRKAELRNAAAEATAASAMQRARAAEITRDVKEIQIRNLEIRLARRTNCDNHSQHASTEWRKACQSIDPDRESDMLRSHHTEPLSPVVEEGEEGYPLSPLQKTHPSSDGTAQCLTAPRQEPDGVFSHVPREREGSGGVNVDGGGRGAVYKFSRSCFCLGVRTVRAGEEAVSAAAAAASEAAEEITRCRESRKVGQDPRSQAQIDGVLHEEYWGSDYCTSV